MYDPRMSADENARRQAEYTLEQVGVELGLDGRCIADTQGTNCTYADVDGSVHFFNFAPIGEDAEMKPQ